jgi:hypothetical protein
MVLKRPVAAGSADRQDRLKADITEAIALCNFVPTQRFSVTKSESLVQEDCNDGFASAKLYRFVGCPRLLTLKWLLKPHFKSCAALTKELRGGAGYDVLEDFMEAATRVEIELVGGAGMRKRSMPENSTAIIVVGCSGRQFTPPLLGDLAHTRDKHFAPGCAA